MAAIATSDQGAGSVAELEQRMPVTSVYGWAAVILCGTLIFVGILWSIFGEIPERVSGEGILQPGGTPIPVTAGVDGYIVELVKGIELGVAVDAGQPLFTVSQDAAAFDLKQISDKLEDKRRVDRERTAAEKEELAAGVASISEQRRQAVRDRKSNDERLVAADLKLRSGKAQRGSTVSENEFQARAAEYEAAFTARESITSTLRRLDAEEQNLNGRINKDQEIRRFEIEEITRQYAKKQETIATNGAISSPHLGRISQILVVPGQLVDAKTPVVQLERLDEKLKALIYVPMKPGKKIRLGCDAQVSPSSVSKYEFGTVKGEVISDVNQPATRPGMIADLGGNKELADEMIRKSGTPFRIEIALKDAATYSGYHWSSGNGPNEKILSGTACSATVIVGRKPPIEYVIAKFQEMFGAGEPSTEEVPAPGAVPSVSPGAGGEATPPPPPQPAGGPTNP